MDADVENWLVLGAVAGDAEQRQGKDKEAEASHVRIPCMDG